MLIFKEQFKNISPEVLLISNTVKLKSYATAFAGIELTMLYSVIAFNPSSGSLAYTV